MCTHFESQTNNLPHVIRKFCYIKIISLDSLLSVVLEFKIYPTKICAGVSNCPLVNLRLCSGSDGVQSRHKDVYGFGKNVATSCVTYTYLQQGVTNERGKRHPSLWWLSVRACSCRVNSQFGVQSSPRAGSLSFHFIGQGKVVDYTEAERGEGL